MSKRIVFEHDGKEYTLEYTLRTAALANQDGFVLDELGDKLALMVPKLVYWAFNKNHKNVTRKMSDEIFSEITQKNEFIAALAEMYAEACNALIDDEDGDTGNANWTLS